MNARARMLEYVIVKMHESLYHSLIGEGLLERDSISSGGAMEGGGAMGGGVRTPTFQKLVPEIAQELIKIWSLKRGVPDLVV